MALTDIQIRKASASSDGKTVRLYDEKGLYLEMRPSGSKLWRLKYRFEGKENRLALGAYPEITLAMARERRDEARRLLAVRVDPSASRKAAKAAGVERAANSFAVIAEEWLAKQAMAASTLEKARWTFDDLVFPWIGGRPIAEIEPPEVLRLLRRIEERGAIETAHRTKQRMGQVFRYAIATGRAQRDPTSDLRGALAPIKVLHRAAITDPNKVAQLLRAIDGYEGGFVARMALKLAPLVFLRPGELRGLEWSEVDFNNDVLRIRAERMKMREEHIVPLSVQSMAILREIHPLTGVSLHVFPSERTSKRCMSEGTINAALRRLGFGTDDMTGHGFRAMASTRLNEMGWAPDVIERQLGHAERNKVRAAYNRASYMTERTTMMQTWADYLDALTVGNVVAIGSARRNTL